MRQLTQGVSPINMNDESRQYRKRIVDEVELLASPADQMKYERDVPIVDVPAELICGFVDDLYHPKSELFLNAFIEQELKSLAELYGKMCIASDAFTEHDCHSVAEILKLKEWRSVIAFAKDLVAELKRNG